MIYSCVHAGPSHLTTGIVSSPARIEQAPRLSRRPALSCTHAVFLKRDHVARLGSTFENLRGPCLSGPANVLVNGIIRHRPRSEDVTNAGNTQTQPKGCQSRIDHIHIVARINCVSQFCLCGINSANNDPPGHLLDVCM